MIATQVAHLTKSESTMDALRKQGLTRFARPSPRRRWHRNHLPRPVGMAPRNSSRGSENRPDAPSRAAFRWGMPATRRGSDVGRCPPAATCWRAAAHSPGKLRSRAQLAVVWGSE